mgnify:CR=1 FL=1
MNNRIFKVSISSFITMVILVIIFVALTCSFATQEKSQYGKTVIDSQGAGIYIESAHLSFQMPSASNRYFVDTKTIAVANYLKAVDAIFGAELKDEPLEMEVYINPSRSSDKEYNDVLYDGEIEINGIVFSHYYYLTHILNIGEYDLESVYTAEVDGDIVEFVFLYYSDSALTISSDREYLDEKFGSIIGSVQYGDTTTTHKSGEGTFPLFNYSFYLGILLIPCLYILAGNMSICKKSFEWNEDALSRNHSKEILGFFALLIVMHHLVQQVGFANAAGLRFLENIGVCFVGAYFFYSGYGLIKSSNSRSDYLKGFLKNRLPVILIPFFVCILIFAIVRLQWISKLAVTDVIFYITGFKLINSHMWYIVEIFFLYILFYVVFKFIKKKKVAYICMSLALLLLVAGSLLAGHGEAWFQGEWWYNTTILFLVGMLFAEHENKIIGFIRKHYTKVVIAALIIFIILYNATMYMLEHYGYWSELEGKTILQSNMDKLYTLLVQMPMVISFVLLIVIVGQKVKCSNMTLRFLGKISLELYLIHNLFIDKLSFISGQGVYFISVITCSIVLAYVIHKLDQLLICRILKKSPEKSAPIGPVIKQQIRLIKIRVKHDIHFLKNHPKRVFTKWFREIVCVALLLITIYPIYMLAINATLRKIILKPEFIPGHFFIQNLYNINSAFSGPGGSIFQGIQNSIYIAVPAAILTTYLGALTAYGFARYRFKGRKVMFGIVIGCMLMPATAGFVGLTQMLLHMHLFNNFIPVILMGIANPAAVYFIYMYLQNINLNDIGEAARIDGAGEFRIFNIIILPLIRPVLALQLTFSFVSSWNNGFVQNVLLLNWEKKTVPSYIKLVAGDNGAAYEPQAYALALAGTLPPLVVYILCSKSIVSSITLGGVKE